MLPLDCPSELIVSKQAWDYALKNRPVHTIWFEGTHNFPIPWENSRSPRNPVWNKIIRAYYRIIHNKPDISHDAVFCEYPVTCGEVAIHSIRRKHMVRQRRSVLNKLKKKDR
jgi:hypothetical protein